MVRKNYYNRNVEIFHFVIKNPLTPFKIFRNRKNEIINAVFIHGLKNFSEDFIAFSARYQDIIALVM